jgi:hypothetical protein
MDPKALEKAIRRLLREDWPDDQLRTKLETLAETEENFSAFTWVWGPVLYKRNRVLFRPFILGRFGQVLRRKKYKWEIVQWKGDVAAALEPWLAEVDRRDDVALFRRLYEWKLSRRGASFGRDLRQKAILEELPARFHAAPSSAAREVVVQKFAIWFSLDEPTARELYRRDPHVAAPFILRHLPWSWLENKRAFWRELLQEARAQGDEKFYWDLYRRQVPRETWEQDVAAVCERVRDPAELVRQLEQHHPHDGNRSLGAGMEKLLGRRGRDVLPYVMRHLTSVRRGFLSGGDYGRLLDLARSQGWWDLWAAIIRVAATPKDFNREVGQLLSNPTLERAEVTRRLGALCGVSRELNFPGFGLAAVHQLDESTALTLLARHPELLRGPFLAHLQVNPWMDSYSKLIDALIAANEDDLLDHVAARIATRVSNQWAPKNRKMLIEADRLADYYDGLKADEARFSRRAASVLNRIPAYTIHNFSQLIRDNRLARLLFARSAKAYLADARSVRDLVEAAEIHVMAMAYSALGLEDDRARALAAENLPLLLGTLLRPLHRSTRMLAFRALTNAATTRENAVRVHAKAREALDLPDEKYPKEALLALIAALVDRWPELRGAREEPVVYRRTAA